MYLELDKSFLFDLISFINNIFKNDIHTSMCKSNLEFYIQMSLNNIVNNYGEGNKHIDAHN